MNHREVMQQALEAIEDSGCKADLMAAADALRAALAEPQEQPLDRCPGCGGPADNGLDRSVPPEPYFCSKCMAEPKAGHPATQRQPLTDEEISSIWEGHIVPVFGKNGINPVVFARAIEIAHGIGGQDDKSV